jgi:UDP-2-acetamido-2-deoxy-ribo-hexuluronate aminotransferase
VTVPFFSLSSRFPRYRSSIERQVTALFDRGDFVNGEPVREFEAQLAAYTGAMHVIAVGNASDGLAIALQAGGLGPGDEVIVPAITFMSSASSVVHAGGTPVFADINEQTYGLDPCSVSRALTRNTRAIMPVHLFHQTADLPALTALARRNNLFIIEDSAEAIGMWSQDRHAGCVGHVGVLSFFPTKTLGAFGDAGAIITNDNTIADSCRELRDHGRRPDDANVAVRVGHSSRLDSVQAVILLARLEHLDLEIAERAELADRYDDRLRALAPMVTLPRRVPRLYSHRIVFYTYVIESDAREDLAEYLARQGVATEKYYPAALHRQPAFYPLGYKPGSFPVAERVCARTLALPLYPGLSNDAIDYVCEAIAHFYARRSGA